MNQNNQNNKKQNNKTIFQKKQNRISILRLMLLLTIAFAGTISGSISFYLIKNSSKIFNKQEFNNMIQDSYKSIQQTLIIKEKMTLELGIITEMLCNKQKNWPYCFIPSIEFLEFTNQLVLASHINMLGILPIVQPNEKLKFEQLALSYYKNDTGYDISRSSIHNEIFMTLPDRSDKPSVISNSSRYKIYVPILEISEITHSSNTLLYDTHSDFAVGSTIESILDCIQNQTLMKNSSEWTRSDIQLIKTKCSSITDFVPNYNYYYSVFLSPIFPYKESNQVVGFSAALFSWESVLLSTSRDSTFSCTISSSTSPQGTLGYVVHKGNPKRSDVRTIKDKPTNFKKSYILNEPGDYPTSTQYTITYYSTETHNGNIPAIIACICCIGITLLISAIFSVFNVLIQKEVNQANALLNSKRIFVRFISHEIRTPLNTIVLGLKLLHENMKLIKDIENGSDVISTNPLMSNDENDVLEKQVKLQLTIDECLDLIHDLDENSTIAVSTLNDLINYDKIETNTFKIEKKLVNMWIVVEKTLNPLSLQAKEKEVELLLESQNLNVFAKYKSSSRSVNFPSTPVGHSFPHIQIPVDDSNQNLKLDELYVMGDSIKLGQVIRNLVSNALKFTPQGGKVKVIVQFEPILIPVTTPRNNRSPNINVPGIDFRIRSPTQSHQVTQDIPLIVGQIVISVIDSGPGLSEEQQKNLFKEGVQFNPNELQAGQGSGLGLWISKEIITLHDGTISVSSDGLGQGSTFRVSLPVIWSEVGAIKTPTSYKPKRNFQSEVVVGNGGNGGNEGIGSINTTDITGSPSKVKNFQNNNVNLNVIVNNHNDNYNDNINTDGLYRGSSEIVQMITLSDQNKNVSEKYVLVVDDASSNRKVVCRFLKLKGYITHEAENGEKCLEMIRSHYIEKNLCYEFILLDFEMPVLNGPLTAHKIREKKEYQDLLVIGLTGNVLTEDIEYFLRSGVNSVHAKPVKIDELLEDVKRLQSMV